MDERFEKRETWLQAQDWDRDTRRLGPTNLALVSDVSWNETERFYQGSLACEAMLCAVRALNYALLRQKHDNERKEMKMKFDVSDNAIASKHFIKLKDKEGVVGVFRGEVHTFRQHWANNRSIECTGAAECNECAKKSPSSFRFRLNFITKDAEAGGSVAKIFEQGRNVYDQLKALHAGDYNLEKTVLRITRSGIDKQTSYIIVPIPKHEVTPAIEKELASVKLHNLVVLEEETQTGASQTTSDSPPPHGDSDEIPW